MFVDGNIVFFLSAATVVVLLLYLIRIKDSKVRLAMILSAVSIFLYSGYGIAYPDVGNGFAYKYIVSVICLYFPFLLLFRRENPKVRISSLDTFFADHAGFLRGATILYFILILLPLFFPRFRLFDVLTKGISIEGIYDYLNTAREDMLGRSIDAITIFIKPFFLAYIMSLRLKDSRKAGPVLLFLLDILIGIMDACYIGRSAMVYDGLLLFFLIFCIKEGDFTITRKQVIILSAIIVGLIPFMYAYTFIRAGLSYDSLSFSESVRRLLASEADYPRYYEHILNSSELQGQTPLSFILWLVFLPIPSVIWPGKPSLSNDVFTYSITGLHRTDLGYSSLLPSYLGESFIYFGEWYYWVYAVLIGFILALILRYLCRSRYMILFVLYLAVRMLAIGRAGATAAVPLFINGSLSVFLLDYLVIRPSRRSHS